jgi:hypothetical protein
VGVGAGAGAGVGVGVGVEAVVFTVIAKAGSEAEPFRL